MIPGGAIVCTSGNLSSKTNVGGALDAADVTFTSVSGSTITQFVIYNDTGVAGTSELIAIYDAATGLPCVPNGGNITLQWAEAPNFVLAFYRKLLRRKRERRGTVIKFDPARGLWLPPLLGVRA